MTLVGHLHYRADPRNVKTEYAYAAVAKAEGIDFVYFTPRRVNLQDKTILGFVYEKGDWVEKTVRFPDVIYNEADRTEKFGPVVTELRRKIPFTSHPIGDKLSVYERLYKARSFRQYLIPTKALDNVKDELTEFILKYKRIVVKPLWGAKGMGVISIEEIEDNRCRIIEDYQTIDCTFHEAVRFVRERHEQEPMLVQKYIVSVTKYGLPYDFRLHVQKNGMGRWVITSVYYRLASFGNIKSNLSSGASTGQLDSFLTQEFGDRAYNMRCYLEQLGLQLAAHLDDVYGESFDELGIDVGVDATGKAWMYEVNWKPGCPPSLYLELDVAKNAILYAAFLAEQHAKRKRG
ncbi:YheC/YheD family endospore coat-associated protein [Alicyclobacillus dauci]|uniref:YheC/YheD family protein n=1 Tax=Alicyclobacillus dauci TaxID=1475485 RepID=A0ABY6Z0R1_9BACL|nr:YheC/YheD family protein [Alicyclobacillus dauci]WAH36307.1 YheC/YheD family protein [Alicyclobacillus dauci]